MIVFVQIFKVKVVAERRGGPRGAWLGFGQGKCVM
jgi:hypothetical protein